MEVITQISKKKWKISNKYEDGVSLESVMEVNICISIFKAL